eukprot:1160690-Pelagomonas_calceolata.AAC.21
MEFAYATYNGCFFRQQARCAFCLHYKGKQTQTKKQPHIKGILTLDPRLFMTDVPFGCKQAVLSTCAACMTHPSQKTTHRQERLAPRPTTARACGPTTQQAGSAICLCC